MLSYWWSICNVSGFCGEGGVVVAAAAAAVCSAVVWHLFWPAQLFGCSVHHFLAQLLLSVPAAASRESVTGVEGCWELVLARRHCSKSQSQAFLPCSPSCSDDRSTPRRHRLPVWRFCVVPRTCCAMTDPTPVVTCYLIYLSFPSPNQVH